MSPPDFAQIRPGSITTVVLSRGDSAGKPYPFLQRKDIGPSRPALQDLLTLAHAVALRARSGTIEWEAAARLPCTNED